MESTNRLLQSPTKTANNTSDDVHMAIDPSEDEKSEADKELESLKQISQKRQLLQQRLEQKVAAKKGGNSAIGGSTTTSGPFSAKKEDPKSRQISPAPSKFSISAQNRYKKYDYRRFVGIDTSSSDSSNHSIFHSDNSSMSEGESAQLGPSDLVLNDSFDGLDILTIQSDVRSEQAKPKPVALSNSRKRVLEERNESEEQAKKKQKLWQSNPATAKLGGKSVAVPPKAASSKYGTPLHNNTNSSKPKSTKK